MKRTILLSVIVLLVLSTSCTVKVSSLTNRDWNELTTIEQTLFNASVYDSTIIKDAIIIEDKVIIFDPIDNTFTRVRSYDLVFVMALTAFLSALLVAIAAALSNRQ